MLRRAHHRCPEDVTAALASFVRITGDLTIGGDITTFPDFAALEVVEGNLTISGLTDGSLVDLASIFSVLTEVQGNLIIQNNANVATITGFVALREVDGNVSIGGATSGGGKCGADGCAGFGSAHDHWRQPCYR